MYRKFKDKLGQSHNRFKQFYKDIEVIGAEYILHEKNEKIFYANGYLANGLDIDIKPTINESRALKNALDEINAETYMWENEQNEIFIKENSKDPGATFYPKGILKLTTGKNVTKIENFRLVYRFNILSEKPFGEYIVDVDAKSGEIINIINNLRHGQEVSGTGISRYNGTKSIKVWEFEDEPEEEAGKTEIKYRLQESNRAAGIRTKDMQNQTTISNAVDFEDNDTHFGDNNDKVGVSVHWTLENTYDYYKNEQNHIIIVEPDSPEDPELPIKSYAHFGSNYARAGWSPTLKHMIYGDGGTLQSPYGNIYTTEFVAIDVVAHEYTHAITQFSSDLIYAGESGALNESFSDIFGNVLEFYTPGVTGTWTKGEDIVTSTPWGDPDLGNMADPNVAYLPDTYLGDYWDSEEEVHTNSWVQNHWFYLLSEGGSGTNDNGHSYSVSAIDIDDASAIAFRNLTVYLWPGATYQDARWHAIDAAADLFGVGSPEWQSVKDAWYAVGVYTPALPSQAAIASSSASNGEIEVEYNCATAKACRIYYDTDNSGHPYNGDDADQGPSPVFVNGGSGTFKLTGITNGERYYIAVKGINEAGESPTYSNEATEVAPITTSGTLITDEIWPADDDPDNIVEITGDIYVADYFMLKIKPGAVIKLGTDVKIETNWYFRPIGTESEPITFTSIYNDPTPSQYWDRIKFNNASPWEVLKYCNIEYANVGTELDHSSGRVEHCTYSNIQSTAIKVIAASPKILDSDITANYYCIYFYNTNNVSNQPEIRRNMIHNSNYGLYMYNSSPDIFDFNEIYETTTASFCYSNSSPHYGGDDYYGNNNIHNNNYGVFAAYSSNPFLGWKGRYNSGNNSITESSQYHILAVNNCLVMAWKNWWGQYPPDENKFNAVTNSTIWYGSALTEPPQYKSSIKLSNDTGFYFTKGSNLRQKINYARHLIYSDSVTFAQDICKDIINNYPDSSAVYFALDVLWEASRNFKSPVTHNLNSFKNYLKELSIKGNNRHLYSYAALVLSGFEGMKGLSRINNIARTHPGTLIGELALFKKFMFYFIEKENIINAEKTLYELERVYPGSISTLEAQNLFNNLSNFGKSLSFKNTNNEYLKIIPDKFELLGNFPNPFNPTTTISFALPKRSEVEIIIYDALGKKIKTLLSCTMDEGIRTTDWDGTNHVGANVSSGIYFYIFRAKSLDGNKKLFVKSAKLLLMK